MFLNFAKVENRVVKVSYDSYRTLGCHTVTDTRRIEICEWISVKRDNTTGYQAAVPGSSPG